MAASARGPVDKAAWSQMAKRCLACAEHYENQQAVLDSHAATRNRRIHRRWTQTPQERLSPPTMTKVQTRKEVGDREAAPASTHALAVLYSECCLAREYAEWMLCAGAR